MSDGSRKRKAKRRLTAEAPRAQRNAERVKNRTKTEKQKRAETKRRALDGVPFRFFSLLFISVSSCSCFLCAFLCALCDSAVSVFLPPARSCANTLRSATHFRGPPGKAPNRCPRTGPHAPPNPAPPAQAPQHHANTRRPPAFLTSHTGLCPDSISRNSVREGQMRVPEGKIRMREGQDRMPDGQISMPEGQMRSRRGQNSVYDGTEPNTEGPRQHSEGQIVKWEG